MGNMIFLNKMPNEDVSKVIVYFCLKKHSNVIVLLEKTMHIAAIRV